jgi:16S rRNA processing protein RimM
MLSGGGPDTGPVLRGVLTKERVVVAEIFKPRGIRGELLGRSQTDIPGRLEALQSANARLADGRDVIVEFERVWRHQDDWIFKLAGVDSIEQAEPFRGADIWVPRTERAELPGDEFFQSDLVGLNVLDGATASELGVVEEIERYGGPPLLKVKYKGREVLIPFVPAICAVDLAARVIRVTLPEGLLEL